MHALVWDGQQLRLDTAYATPQTDDAIALVRVHLAGICATDLQPSADVVVLGDGKLGLLCAQVLHSTGARVCVVGKHPHKLGLLHQFGISTVVLTDWQPRPADVVVEATGSTTGFQLAMTILRPRGTLVLKSTVATAHARSLAPLVINEITVIGSRCGRFPPALQALEHYRVAVAPLIDESILWRKALPRWRMHRAQAH